ncbi:DUF1761 domain-containing protein [Jeotgalibacillus proteolyticus]|uniref:DUF1761 domain-containing protein n=1 Tax=Jeotgalibacillus proteolyticus TaxID=2082395 RepID=UPI003CF147BE
MIAYSSPIAVLFGAILYIIYGTVYYSILLKDKKEQSTPPIHYVISIIIAFISSFLIGILVQSTGAEGMAQGALIGFIMGAVITLVYFKNSLFGLITKKNFTIAAGDHLVIFTLLGTLHGFFI